MLGLCYDGDGSFTKILTFGVKPSSFDGGNPD